MKKGTLITLLILGIFCIGNSTVCQAQKIGVNVNFKAFGIDKVQGQDSTTVDSTKNNAVSLNLRFYDKKKWAIRLGLGVSNLEYGFENGAVQTNYDVARRNMTAYLGLEKHFDLPLLTPYLGVFVPVTFSGDDKVTEVVNNFANSVGEQVPNGSVSAGFSVLAGAQFKIFRIIRIGAEFNGGFSSFKDEVIDNLLADGKRSSIKLKNLDYNGEITVGVAF